MGRDSASDDDSDDPTSSSSFGMAQDISKITEPMIKKIKRHAKHIEKLQLNMSAQQDRLDDHAQALREQIRELEAKEDGQQAELRQLLGDRATLADIARIEEKRDQHVSALQSDTSAARTTSAANEMILTGLVARVHEAESNCQRLQSSMEEKLNAAKTEFQNSLAHAALHQAELQQRVVEAQGQAKSELTTVRCDLESELKRMAIRIDACAQKSETENRLSELLASNEQNKARMEKQEVQIAVLTAELSEAKLQLSLCARQSELAQLQSRLVQEASQRDGESAKAASRAASEADERNARLEQRQHAVESRAAATQLEIRQMSANLEDFASHLGGHALSADLTALRGEVKQGFADVRIEHATKDEVARLLHGLEATLLTLDMPEVQRQLQVAQDAASVLNKTVHSELERKAGIDALRSIEMEVVRLARDVQAKMDDREARSLLEQRADRIGLEKLSETWLRDGKRVRAIEVRLEAAQAASTACGNDAREARESAQAVRLSCSELQARPDATVNKQADLLHSAREEQAQLIRVVHALLMDAELRANNDSKQETVMTPRSPLTMPTFGRARPPARRQDRRHGWVAPATGSLSARGELAAVDVRGRVSPQPQSSPPPPANSTKPWSAEDADGLLGRRRKALAQPHGNAESLQSDLGRLASVAAPGLRSRTVPGAVSALGRSKIA